VRRDADNLPAVSRAMRLSSSTYRRQGAGPGTDLHGLNFDETGAFIDRRREVHAKLSTERSRVYRCARAWRGERACGHQLGEDAVEN
jgi:hypothetical protein